MTDESDAAHWERIQSVFADALELPDGERAAFVARAAGDDLPLLHEVSSLLAAHAQAGPLMAAPTLGPDDWPQPTGASGAVAAGAAGAPRAPGAPGAPRTGRPERPERLARYAIRSLLGTGGMGEVYLAHDPLLDRQVALKVLPGELAEHPQRRARFLQEARAAASLNHPNITTIHEIGEADGRDFIAFEYVEGRTLRERIAGQPMPLQELLDIAVPLADALAHAHERGLVHRDVKSANVMVTARGLPKLLDFGLAKLVQAPATPGPHAPHGSAQRAASGEGAALTLSGTITGTPEAMSPEQAQGRDVDQRTDVFSFGSLLHEMACGRAAFSGRGPQDTLEAVIHAQPASLHELRPELPAAFVAIVERALRKRPEERYQSLAELAADLRALPRSAEPHDAGRARTADAPAVDGTRTADAPLVGGARPADAPMAAAAAAAPQPPVARRPVRAVRAVRARRVALAALAALAVVLAALAWRAGWLPGSATTASEPSGPRATPAAAPPSVAESAPDTTTSLAPGSATRPAATLAGVPAAAKSVPAAVMCFENTTDPADAEQLGDMLCRLLTTHLATGSDIPMVSQQRLYEAARDLGRSDGRVDRSSASAVAQRAGVGIMILGSVTRSGTALVATAEVVDATTGRTLGSHQARGTDAADVFTLAASLGRQVRDTLREPALSAVEKQALDDQLTTSVEAFRAFIRGLEALQRNHPEDAAAALRQATALDPAFALAHYRLAMALVWTGRQADIGSAIERAAAFAERLPPNIRLVLNAALPYFTADDTRSALPLLLEAIATDPQNPDALYMLGEIYTHSATRNDAHRAAEMYARLLALDRGLSLVYEQLLSACLRTGQMDAARARVAAWKELQPDNLAELEGTLALWEGRYADAAALLRDRLAPDMLTDTALPEGAVAEGAAPAGAGEPNAVHATLALGVPAIAESVQGLGGVYRVLALDLRADLFVMHGRFAEAEQLDRLAADVPGAHSLDGFLTNARAGARHRLAFLLALQGDVAGARQQAAATLELQPDSHRCLYVSALLALRDGDDAAAQRSLATLADLATRGFCPSAELYRDALAAELELAHGEAAQARAHFAALVGSGRLMEDWYVSEDSLGPALRDGLARACLAAGDAAGAAQAWDGLLASGVERLREPLLWVSALLARGKLALQGGDEAGGRAFLERFLHFWGHDGADAAATSLPQVIEARALLAALPPR